MKEIKPEDIRVGQMVRASRMEYDADPARFKHMTEKRMRECVADFIQHTRGELRLDECFAEMRIDLYVATPEQFWGLVHKEAQEIALRFAPR